MTTPWLLKTRFVTCLALPLCLLCSSGASQQPAADARALQGLWTGTWGGGERDGVVFQPVIAELVVKGDRVALHGFRGAGNLAGTFRLDEAAQRIHIVSSADNGGPKSVSYAYQIKGDKLTLIDNDEVSVVLHRVELAQNPLGSAQVELIAAAGFNDAGDLLVTEFNVLRARPAGHTYYQPVQLALPIEQAAVRLIEESGWHKITVDQARQRIQKSTPVAVIYQGRGRPSGQQAHKLWKDTGPPAADSEAVERMLSRTLRSGTVVFILPARPAPRP